MSVRKLDATSTSNGAGAAPVKLKRKKSDHLPGEQLGFPMYHSVTGNLPVLSQHLWKPVDGDAAIRAPPSDYELYTGNLPVLSHELFQEDPDELPPGWVELFDPVIKRKYWWNIYYKSRREQRPNSNDDGHTGARRGEEYMRALHSEYSWRTAVSKGSEAVAALAPSLRRSVAAAGGSASSAHGFTWVEHYDKATMRPYYCNESTGSCQWEKPADYSTNCKIYEPNWEEIWDADKNCSMFRRKRDGFIQATCPSDFDNTPLIDCWQECPDEASGQVYFWNFVSGERQWTKPESWPRSFPAGPPPAPPAAAGASSVVAAAGAGEVIEEGGAVDLLAVQLAAMKVIGANTLAAEEEDDTIIYGDYRGYLKKKGGGTSLFGRRNWKERFFVISRGTLTYYDNQEDWEKKREPLKGVRVTLRLYSVDPMVDNPTKFALIPAPVEESSESIEEETEASSPQKKAATSKREFHFEASSSESKAKWIKALRGRRADGRHRADSDTFSQYYTAARQSVAGAATRASLK